MPYKFFSAQLLPGDIEEIHGGVVDIDIVESIAGEQSPICRQNVVPRYNNII